MTLKIINNSGDSKDTMVYDQETATAIVPGLLPVTAVHVSMIAGQPVTVLLQLDHVELDVEGVSHKKVMMRMPGTQSLSEVAEIRWKNGHITRFA